MAVPLITIPGVIPGRLFGFFLLLFILGIVVYYMRQGKAPYIRRVPALDAIEDAVGRSTEMGKPVFATYGRPSGFDYWTMAGLTIMKYVAGLCAKNDTRVIVPTGGLDASLIVRPVAVEMVRAAFIEAGKEDHFNEDDIPFLSALQPAFISGIVGLMQRLLPGAVILSGAHAYEGMSICEQSNIVGAITIAGASYVSNMAGMACSADYLIVGEEMPAAGAYLSKEPPMLASIRCQDIFKFVGIGLIIVGCIAVSFGNDIVNRLLVS